MNNVGDWNGMILDRIKALEDDVDSLKLWRAWLFGVAVPLGIATGVFAKAFWVLVR